MRTAAPTVYQDRHHAGEVLAAHLPERLSTTDAVILALPRGGVPIGLELARALHAPLDVFVVRKLGVPEHPELAMGAMAAGGTVLWHDALIAELGITPAQTDAVTRAETAELQRRDAAYRADRPPVEVHGRTAILVDDGLATGFTMRAAIVAVRRRGPAAIVVAVPVGARETCAEIAQEVELLVCPLQPSAFHAVGAWYRDFNPTTDDEVRHCLAEAAHLLATHRPSHR